MEETKQSESVRWRQQGNEQYTSINNGLAPILVKDRLGKASYFYRKAFDSGTNEDEKVSAAKNLAMSNWRLVVLIGTGDITNQDKNLAVYHCKEAFKHFSFAYLRGKNIKSEEWLSGVLNSTRTCWEDILSNILQYLDLDPRCNALYGLLDHIQIGSVKAEMYLKLTEYQFHRGIIAIQGKDYKTCLHALRECYMPLNEAQTLNNDENIVAQVRVMEADIFMHQCMADSMQALAIGDEMFEQVVLQQEDLNIDMVWEVVDWYKQASLRTREITELELEAKAVSRLGRVFDRVLKMPYRAKEYYKHTIELALSMAPRSFIREEWYNEAVEMLEKYQQNTVQAEDERRQQETAEIRKELKEELMQLKDSESMSHENFLQFIYKTFPPKSPKAKLVIPEGKQNETTAEWKDRMKKVMLKAVTHYHPDGVPEDQYGNKWKLLSEEITKYLNKRYGQLKLI